ncbi:hypothetical protein CIT292_07772 [Citrobacter youngae ATCC 29220]|uniref:Uncharacterized protein n=1 Tax=Citrobacter youngae ATCC 29220 TaxID=500640 RepID=D4BBC3_9ENTR|nr:hypothetical protein CIT292_07772 [Citrobacter youngae ATCC 29220]
MLDALLALRIFPNFRACAGLMLSATRLAEFLSRFGVFTAGDSFNANKNPRDCV